MLAKIDKSLHIINKAYWHMICHIFMGIISHKEKRSVASVSRPACRQTDRHCRLPLARRETGLLQGGGNLLRG